MVCPRKLVYHNERADSRVLLAGFNATSVLPSMPLIESPVPQGTASAEELVLQLAEEADQWCAEHLEHVEEQVLNFPFFKLTTHNSCGDSWLVSGRAPARR